MIVLVSLIAHQAETGGGPRGFGLASFLTLLVGLVAIAFMLARYMLARGGSHDGTFVNDHRSTTGELTESQQGHPKP